MGITTLQSSSSPAQIIGRPLPAPLEQDEPTIELVSLTGPRALVLGSTMGRNLPDGFSTPAGIDLLKRRGGGGAVLASADELSWFKVLLPAGDSRWETDVSVAFEWVGKLFGDALHTLGIDTSMHTGALAQTRWSNSVCYSGVGPGELFVDLPKGPAKVVGISQRRTRDYALFQVSVVKRWLPADYVSILDLPNDALADLAHCAIGLELPDDTVFGAVKEASQRA